MQDELPQAFMENAKTFFREQASRHMEQVSANILKEQS